LQQSWKTTSELKGADRCTVANLGQWVDGVVQHLACVLYFLTVQATLEEPHPKGLGHPPVRKLASQDVLVLQAAPHHMAQCRYTGLGDGDFCCDPPFRKHFNMSCQVNTGQNPKVGSNTCSGTKRPPSNDATE